MKPVARVVVALAVTFVSVVLLGPIASSSSTAEPMCPGGSNPSPDVVLCEDFEDTAFQSRWALGSHFNTWPLADFALCTGDNFGFKSRCAAWSNNLIFDNAWGFWGYDSRRSFPPQAEFYVRWYQYISNPYSWGPLEDKSVMLHDQANTLVAYVGTSRNHLPVVPDSGPGRPFVANYQDVDVGETGGLYTKVNRFQNQSQNITLEPGNWYFFEWYLKLNDPGISNGVTKLWVADADGSQSAQTLRMHYTDMRWLRTQDAGKRFGVVRLTVYDQRCDIGPNTCPPNGPTILAQSHRWDQLVISTSPIAPLGAPAAPTNVRIIR